MPRKSAASLSVVQALPGQQRPEPPAELSDEQAVEWRKVVDRLPADWFPAESHQLLVAYVRHVVNARVIAGKIRAFDPAWLDEPEGLQMFDKLTMIGDREGRAISSLATRMRLTQQSRFQKTTATVKASNAGYRPWATATKAGA
jgi:hypothetical protein